MTWRSDASYANEGHWFPTREDRRAHAIHFIKTGSLQGYLAYCGDEIVDGATPTGIVNIASITCVPPSPIEEYREDVRVKSIFCFVITPRLQRQGIATQLVERVCMDAAGEGYDFVEAYVNSNFIDTCQDFRGACHKCMKMRICQIR